MRILLLSCRLLTQMVPRWRTAFAFTTFYNDKFILDYSAKLHKFNSIYQAELMAIFKAIEWFMNSGFYNVIIYTDSFSSVMALQSIFPRNTIVKNIFDLLIKNKDKSVYLGWIKALVRLLGNERADELAKSAINDETVQIIDVDFPTLIVKRYCKQLVLSNWQESSINADVGRDTYQIFNKVNEDFLCNSQILLYYCTAHGSFPDFLYKINKRSNNRCDYATVVVKIM